MKKIMTIIFILASKIILSQVHQKNTFSFNADFDAGFHLYSTEIRYNGMPFDGSVNEPAASAIFRFDAQYGITNWLSAGVLYRTGSFLEDTDSHNDQFKNNVSDYSLNTRIYFLNKEKMAMYGGIYAGISTMKVDDKEYLPAKFYKWSGNNYGLDLGFNWYFAKKMGMNLALGYSAHNYVLKEYTSEGSVPNLEGWTQTVESKGLHLTVGLAYKL